jgi:hypothetical protein
MPVMPDDNKPPSKTAVTTSQQQGQPPTQVTTALVDLSGGTTTVTSQAGSSGAQLQQAMINQGSIMAAGTPMGVKQENMFPYDLSEFQNVLIDLTDAISSQDKKEAEAKAAKSTMTSQIATLSKWMNDGNIPQEAKNDLQNFFDLATNKMQLGAEIPSYLSDLRIAALEQGKDAKGVVSKIVARIPKFDGNTKSKYTWSHFWTAFGIAVSNASYQDYELRAIFLSCLEGNALEHYRAHQETYINLKYDELVARYADRYDEKK